MPPLLPHVWLSPTRSKRGHPVDSLYKQQAPRATKREPSTQQRSGKGERCCQSTAHHRARLQLGRVGTRTSLRLQFRDLDLVAGGNGSLELILGIVELMLRRSRRKLMLANPPPPRGTYHPRQLCGAAGSRIAVRALGSWSSQDASGNAFRSARVRRGA